jgi:tetratricopeptide (TPR) repeat protein
MSDKEHIAFLIKQAEIYRKQGLLKNARKRYLEALQSVEQHERFSRDGKLINGLRQKIRGVENDMDEIEQAPDRPKLPVKVQTLIRNLFAVSETKELAAIEGALALAKFGQYEGAVTEFSRLIKAGILPMVAAKNLLRCHLTLCSADAAVDQFRRWISSAAFTGADLSILRVFLEHILEAKGIYMDLPQVSEASPDIEERHEKEEEGLELSSLSVRLEAGPRKGQVVDFDVSFQSAITLSVVIPADQKELVDAFEPGLRLSEVQCYSPLAVFNVSGTVTGKSRIPSGPRKGAFSVDITIGPL